MEQSLSFVGLKQNQQLVNYFVGNFYTSVDAQLVNLVSTSFRFSVDNGPEMDFEKYVKRKNFMQDHIRFIFNQPITTDDIFFTTNFSLAIPRVDQPVLYCGGEMTLLVIRGLVESIIVVYDETGGDNLSVQTAIKKIRKLNNTVNFI